MKNIIQHIFFVLCLFLFACTGNKVKNDLNKANLNGKVKTLTETNYSVEVRNGEILTDKTIILCIYKYDKKGNLKETLEYRPVGDLPLKCTFDYNNGGKRTGSNDYNRDGSLERKTIYQYDNRNCLIVRYDYDRFGSLMYKDTYEYDIDENTKMKSFDSDNNCIFLEIRKYNERGYNTEMTYDYFDGRSGKYVYEYDVNGNMKELNTFDKDGGLIDNENFKYDNFDKEKNWRKKITFHMGIPSGIDKREIEYH